MSIKRLNKLYPKKKLVKSPPPPEFGAAMIGITNLIGTKPDLAKINKPTKTLNGSRKFKDEKGTFFETNQKRKKGYVIIGE